MVKKIVLAIDSFKGSASSLEIETYIENGMKQVLPDVEFVKVPIADGGEGTVESIVVARNGKYIDVNVVDPLGRPIVAQYGLLDDGTAVLEMAMASGITLLKKEELDPMKTSTYGTGQMILDAINKGAKRIFIGIGGSATNDGGLGMAMALGAKFYDANGHELPAEGASVGKVDKVDISGLDARLSEVDITILSDVENPLCGEHGASYVFGPQKGATPSAVKTLDNNLKHYANILKMQIGKDVADIPGSGAAGGLGAGLLAFTKAHARKGIEAVLDLIKLKELLAGADLVITGEGHMDYQTAFGKAPVGVSTLAQVQDIPVMAVVGGVALNVDNIYEKGICYIADLIPEPMELERAIKDVQLYANFTGKNLGQLIKRIM